MRILYVTTGLGVGGAERALERLLPALAARGFTLAVVSLREPQPVGARLRELGIEVHELGMKPSRPSLAGLIRLWRVVRRFRPNVLQGWMYHGNLAAQLARLAAPRAKVLLSIHQTLARLELESLATRTVIRLDAWLSRFAAKVLYVAQAAVAQHEAAGYARRALVLPNPLDTGVFRPDPHKRAQLRQALSLGEQQFVISMLGRFHPAKNHEGFLRAAESVAAERASATFLMAGLEVSPANPALAPLLAVPALRGRVQALGARDDIPDLLAASDLLVLSSIQEALPNVVMEAMSCGVPCVVTDVGDAARMIGDTGWLVAPADDEALADAMIRALDEQATSLAQRGAAARNRAVTHFGLDAVTARHAALYRSLV